MTIPLSLPAETVDWKDKGFPFVESVAVKSLPETGCNVLSGDMFLPVLVLKDSALTHNINLMRGVCRSHGVSLAPHSKTAMAPRIVFEQLSAGAWGMTAATISQVRVLRKYGIQRVILANELVERAALKWVVGELERDRSFDFTCFVDSLDGVAIMDRVVEELGGGEQLQVLIELGAQGGRAGCRSVQEAVTLAAAVREAAGLKLAGVGGYEGVLERSGVEATLDAVDEFLLEVRRLTIELANAGLFEGLAEIRVSAGGSAFFDRVIQCLQPPWPFSQSVRIILRCGVYIAHDIGGYEEVSPLAGRAEPGQERLQPALEIWGAVLSRPEPDLVIVGFGKRDAPFDEGFPTPLHVTSPPDHTIRNAGNLRVTDMNDQHAYLRGHASDVRVGDFVGCGISHPCTAFDKWRLVPVVNDTYDVITAMRTFF
jgi:D-serine deaminase-like pyridoxal phosphate-dependent protein